MQARKLPAHQGWTWIIQSFRLWQKNPLVLTTCATTFIIIVMLPAMLIPVAGQVIAVFVAPPLTVGMYLVCRAIDLGQTAQQGMLFQGFRQNMRNLMRLSAILIIMTVIVDAVVMLIDDGTLTQAFIESTTDAQNAPQLELSTRAWVAIGISILFYCFMTMVNYFAPQLVGLKQLSPVKALVFSLLAYWRNLSAFLVFVVGLVAVALCIAVISSLFSAALPILGPILLVLFLMLLVPCSMAASYLAVKDIFGDLLEESNDV